MQRSFLGLLAGTSLLGLNFMPGELLGAPAPAPAPAPAGIPKRIEVRRSFPQMIAAKPAPPRVDQDLSSNGLTTDWAARLTDAGVQLQFRTTAERGSIGFDLYRETSGAWLKVHPERIEARDLDQGASYQILDSQSRDLKPRHYQLVEMNYRAQRRLLADFWITPEPAGKVVARAVMPTRRLLAADSVRDDRIAQRRAAAARVRLTSVTPEGGKHLIKITVDKNGVHRLSAEDVALVMVRSVSEVRNWFLQGTVGLHYLGQPLGYLPTEDGSSIYYYVPLQTGIETDKGYVWLSGASNAVTPPLNGESPSAGVPGTFRSVVNAGVDTQAVLTLTSDPTMDYWMWGRMTAEISLTSRFSTQFSLEDVVNGAAVLKVRLFGGSETQHRVRIELNDTVLGTEDFALRSPFEVTYQLPAGLLKSGDNLISTVALLRENEPTSRVYLDKLTIEYPRTMNAVDGVADVITTSAGTITLGKLSGSVRTMDVTNPRRPRWVTQVTPSTDGNGDAQVTFRAPAGAYVAVQESGAPRHSSIESIRITGLHDRKNRADYLIVSPADLLTVAQPFAEYRRAQGLETMVVTMQDIANEFGNGVGGPTSLKEFLRYAYSEWAKGPQYVMLMGDGTYDYRNLQRRNDNAIPALMTNTEFGLHASDQAYAELRALGDPLFAIGRLPVVTLTEAQRVVRKSSTFEREGIRSGVIMTDAGDAGGDFVEEGRRFLSMLNPKVPSVQLSGDRNIMRSELFTRMSSGLGLLNYVGHGSAGSFGRPPAYLSLTDVPGLSSPIPTLVLAMTCVVGQFETPGEPCVGEQLVTKTDGGAVAVYAPSGLGYQFESGFMNEGLIKFLPTQGNLRLGDIILKTIHFYREERNGVASGNYNLIGDPALQVHLAP